MTDQKKSAQVTEPEEESVHLRDYFNVLTRRWKIGLLVFILVVGGVAAVTFLMKPVYQASVTLRVAEKSKKGMLQELGVGVENSAVSTEVEVLKSRSVAEQVVRNLGLNWQVAEKTQGFKGRLADFSAGGTVTRIGVQVTGDNRFRVTDEAGKVLGEGTGGTPFRAGGVELTLELDGSAAGSGMSIQRRPQLEVVEALMKRTSVVEVGKGTNVLRLSYLDTDPRRASEVANMIARVYQEQSVQSNTREAGMTVDFINQQLSGLKSVLDKTEQDLQEYKVKSGLATLGPEGASLVDRLVKLEQQKSELNFRARRLESAITEAQKAIKNKTSFTPPILEDIPLSGEIVGRLGRLEAERKTLLEDYTELHPAVLEIDQKIQQDRDALLSAYRSADKDLQVRLRDVDQGIARYERQLDHIPGAEQELAKKSRVNKVNSELFTFLLQRQQEAQIAQASTLSNVEIIDPAFVPERPVKPNKRKNLALGLILGLMLGAGSSFFLDYLDDTINDADEVKKELGLPVIGILPRIDQPGAAKDPSLMLVGNLAPKSPPVEAYRALRTGIHFATAQSRHKVLMVTSSLPGEGKSTLSANLSVVLAQTGAKVLLVGCDLRRPSLSEMFKVANVPGLTDLLVENAKDYLKRVPGLGLDVIAGGTIPPNPAELLSSARMAKFVEYAREHYDYVVLDAPPVLPVTDAQVLGALADEVLVVLEPCRIPRKAAQRTVETLRHAKANLIGVALNDKSGKGYRYYGNYGYYGHKYYGGYYGEGKTSAEPGGALAKARRFFG